MSIAHDSDGAERFAAWTGSTVITLTHSLRVCDAAVKSIRDFKITRLDMSLTDLHLDFDI
jgi:hypothetical protein